MIDPKDLPFEFLMNALRLRLGFQESLFEERTGLSIHVLEPLLSQSIEEGLLIKDQGRIHCSKTGFHFLDTILQRFLP